MRNIVIAPNEYYHVLNRGVNKQVIFHDDADYRRFLFLILCLQSDLAFSNIRRLTVMFPNSVQHSVLNTDKIVGNRSIELTSFCLMPNHFHLAIKEVGDGGIAAYMQRVLNAYTKYYNKRYEKSGHLFQGPYKAVHIGDNRQLLHLSAYIHRNSLETAMSGSCLDYPWSSYQDFVRENRFGSLLVPDIITGQFSDRYGYREFVETSLAKTDSVQ